MASWQLKGKGSSTWIQEHYIKSAGKMRAEWKSRLGFIAAAVGSAVGLGNIWRFPYIVGEGGGAAFVLVYVLCLFLVGLPVLLSEIIIGRKTALSPAGAFHQLGRSSKWKKVGAMTIFTGLIVASFYSVVSGWTLGYLIQALQGKLTHFSTVASAENHFLQLTSSSFWCIGYHLLFMAASAGILYAGVQRGIEAWNKVLMPLLFLILLGLVAKGLTMSGAYEGLQFLFSPKWSALSPSAILLALGQAFFALSLGQGTMVTYGSYVSDKENVPSTCLPIATFGLFISLLAGMAIFSTVFSVGLKADSGPSLMYETLPLVFSQVTGGYLLAVSFFALVFMAAITSQISAMEPMIAYLGDRFKWKRHKAVLATAISAFLLGIPSALAFGQWSTIKFFG
ncbi:MAG TPA: sodium-dependent transporter, partial [Chlamydiales bacterium]|nr:sodium-dependent transporter [Chlamydiales bacterium]